MRIRIKKWLAVAVIAAVMAGMLSYGVMTVFAYTDEAAVIEEQTVEIEPSVVEEVPAETEGTPFSVPGNGQLVDDIENDSTKQFLTVQTKNGNTFFLVVDRSSNLENVYMLSMIDENDLAEFIDGEMAAAPEPETEAPQIVIPEIEPEPAETEAIEIPEEPEPTDRMAVLAIGLVLAVLIGSIYYVKVVKPKKSGEGATEEDLEFYDGGAYINEDQAGTSDNE